MGILWGETPHDGDCLALFLSSNQTFVAYYRIL